MQSILMSSQSFYILIINFILILLTSSEDYNTILLITDKFSKTVIFISDWKTMTAENWAIELLNHLILLNWDLLWIILSDRDCKFTAVLWKKLFKQLYINLMFSLIYHSQTDSSSEVINQIAEMTLQHWLTTLKKFNDWLMILSHLQTALNNSTKYSLTNLSSNQILFSFWMCEVLDLICVDESEVVESVYSVISVFTVSAVKLIKSVNINSA